MPYDSKAEALAAPIITALGGSRCTSFAPYLSDLYQDAEGESLSGKPDFVIHRPHGQVFIELKDGVLNDHFTRESSRTALASEYRHFLGRCPDSMSHAALSTALFESGGAAHRAALAEGFNNSRWKLAAIQARHGWRHFVVCFKDNPKPADAERYCAAGIIWCTLKKLPQFLIRLELEAEGISIPYVHTAQKFSYKVEFDNGTANPSEARRHFLSTVADTKAAAAAQEAKDAADFAAGISPF